MSNKSRLDAEQVVIIKTDIAVWGDGKIKFHQKWADELNCCKRTIQNIILGNSWKNVEPTVRLIHT